MEFRLTRCSAVAVLKRVVQGDALRKLLFVTRDLKVSRVQNKDGTDPSGGYDQN